MNKIFRLVWSSIQSAWIAVSELAKSKGKSGGVQAALLIVLAGVALAPIGVNAAPADPSGIDAIAIGEDSVASGSKGVAVGSGAKATGIEATALGASSEASGPNSTAIGGGKANDGGAIAIGNAAVADANNSMALGTNAQAIGDTSLAIGANAQALDSRSVAIGLNSLAAKDALAFGNYSNATGELSIAIGSNSFAADGSSAIGANARADATLSVALGTGAAASAGYSTAVGSYASATAVESTAFGSNSLASGQGSIALGSTSQANSGYSVAIGGSTTSGYKGASIGNGAVASGDRGLALGSDASADADYSVALGALSVADGSTLNQAAYNPDANSNVTIAGATPLSEVSVGIPGFERRITNLAAGATDTDAVNVSQLKASVANSVMYDDSTHNNIALGGAAYDSSTQTGGTTIANLANGVADSDAVNMSQLNQTNSQVATNTTNISNLDGRVTNIAGDVTALQDDALLWDSAANGGAGAFSANHGGTGPNTITNVAAGALSATSTDAVNGSQLLATNNTVTSIGDTLTSVYETGTKYFHANSTGTDSIASGQDSVAIGMGAVSSHDGSVALGANSVADGGNLANQAYLVGGAATGEVNIGNRRITGLSAGAQDTDAVNVSQLKAVTSSSVADAVMYDNSTHNNITLGGTAYDSSTQTGGTTISNVANGVADSDAVNMSQLNETNAQVTTNTTDISNLDGRVTTIAGDVTALQDDALLWDSAANGGVGAFSANHGGTGPNTITNVAAGALSATSSDAVNGSQLFATNNIVTSISDLLTNVYETGTKYFHANSIGPDSIASGQDSVAIGMGAVSSHDGSVALGANSVADGSTLASQAYLVGGTAAGEVNIGNRRLTGLSAGAENTDAVNVAQLKAVSSASVADAVMYDDSTHNGITLGGTTYDNTTQTGGSTITNVANGVADSDAVNMSQLNKTNTQVATNTSNINNLANDALLWDATLGAFSASHGGTAPNIITNVADGDLSATSSDAVNGSQLFALGNQVSNIDGRVTTIEGNINNINNGAGIKYFHANSSGADSVASGADSVAIGPNASASGAGSLASGNGSSASGAGATALGEGASASADGSVALGKGASDGGRGSESYTGKYSSAANDTAGTVSIGNAATGETRTLSNVADGKEATDGVNLRQLDGAVAESKKYTDDSIGSINSNVANVDSRVTDIDNRVTKAVGDVSNLQSGTDGMFQVNNSSKLAKPTATGTDSMAGGAGSKASGANSAAVGTNANAAGNNSVAMGNGSHAKADNSVALGANSISDRANSVSVGAAGSERQITNVAAGTSNTDAVNVGQLNSSLADVTNNANAYTDNAVNTLRKDIKALDSDLSAGIAGAMAMAALPQPYTPGASMTSGGMGTYRGESALALGVSRISDNGRWVTKLQATTNTRRDVGASVGVGYQW